MAAVTTDKVVYLFDDAGERKDKFKTKPADAQAGITNYIVRAMGFSPDSTKLAIAQSDNIVFVYRHVSEGGRVVTLALAGWWPTWPVGHQGWCTGRGEGLMSGTADQPFF
jgi:hypothetical protein